MREGKGLGRGGWGEVQEGSGERREKMGKRKGIEGIGEERRMTKEKQTSASSGS